METQTTNETNAAESGGPADKPRSRWWFREFRSYTDYEIGGVTKWLIQLKCGHQVEVPNLPPSKSSTVSCPKCKEFKTEARCLAAQVQKVQALQGRYFRGEKRLLEECREAEAALRAMAKNAMDPPNVGQPSLFDHEE